MGRTVLAFITPEICCSCFNKAEEETINFILQLVWGEANDFWITSNSTLSVEDFWGKTEKPMAKKGNFCDKNSIKNQKKTSWYFSKQLTVLTTDLLLLMATFVYSF